MNLTTLARVKRLAGLEQTNQDELIVETIESVSAVVEDYLDRKALVESRTEYLDTEALQTIVGLNAWPIASITSVHYDPDGEFDGGEEELDQFDDWNLIRGGETGLLRIRITLGDYARSLKVVHTGGMATSTDALVQAYPDVAMAVTRQVVWELRTRGIDGFQAASEGRAGSVTMPEPSGLIRGVEMVLQRHKRRAMV